MANSPTIARVSKACQTAMSMFPTQLDESIGDNGQETEALIEDRISVALVDDHALVRRGFRRILEDSPEMLVVGEASDGIAAVKIAQELRPRAVIMDCALPAMNGLMATRRIVSISPHTCVLMLSMHAEDTWVRKALDAGARGYILKNAVDLDLVTAVKRVVAGEVVLDSQLSRAPLLKGERNYGLTQRELQILQHIVAGKSNKEIATHLDISVNTVAVHRANMMQALGIHNAAGLVAYAIRNGLINIL
jgi:DNA-binding NarL/FixJ family response regulator